MKQLIEQLRSEVAKLHKSKAHRIGLKLDTIEQIIAEPDPVEAKKTKPETN
jgi:hypothetical protein